MPDRISEINLKAPEQTGVSLEQLSVPLQTPATYHQDQHCKTIATALRQHQGAAWSQLWLHTGHLDYL